MLVRFYQALFSKDVLDMQIQTDIINDLELSLTDNEREMCGRYFHNRGIASRFERPSDW